jgi:DNA-binding NarL/FixJ family response regulator
MILDDEPDIEVVAQAGDGNEGVRLAQHHLPDVVLMDIRMPGLDGIAATRLLTNSNIRPASRVVILTTYDLDEYVFDAIAAGASGFLLKDVPPEDLVRGIRQVAAGDGLLAPAITRRLIEAFAHQYRRRDEAPSIDALSPRERQVLGLIARGLNNVEIAESLYLSENTIKTHVAHLLDKLALRDRIHAVIYAYEAGLVEPGAQG